ncbi:MAG: transcription regulator of the Arc/MetJ class [Acidobacteria bacterium]|nr:transcription regulator of the Arc/MetJ class [Acidobacteriota bacterium]
MKRTNVVLDDALLDEAVRLSGERTYTATIHRALKEMVARIKVRSGLAMLEGSGMWEGDLAEMRDDHPRRPARRWAPPKGVPVRALADQIGNRVPFDEAERGGPAVIARTVREPQASMIRDAPLAEPPKGARKSPAAKKELKQREGVGAKGRGGKRGPR